MLIFPLGWVKSSVLELPAHKNLSYHWNYGSMLGIIFFVQFMSGLFLSFYYYSKVPEAFFLVNLNSRSVFNCEVLRVVHLNFASLFFLFIYMHMGRNLLHSSFRLKGAWGSGVTIYILLMATAFLGYVLPYGQMSLWGATVITNFLSVISIPLVIWIWGNFSVSQPTLGFFYSLHFLLPFLLIMMILFHLEALHESGSSSKIKTHSGESKLSFNKSYTIKDSINLSLVVGTMSVFLYYPYTLGDPENFILGDSLVSPLHIKPEWYFLWMYAILRSIPNKSMGVVALGLSLLMLYLLLFQKKYTSPLISPQTSLLFVLFGALFLLTWLGGSPVEDPFILLGQITTFSYFLFFSLIFFTFSQN